jgi:hypothetical protein
MSSLEEIQAALDEEQAKWNKQGLDLNKLQVGAAGPMLLDLSIKLQTLINILIQEEIITEEDCTLMYKTLLLNDLRKMREDAPNQQSEAIRQQILSAAQIRMNDGKLPWKR